MKVFAMYLPQFHRVKENDEWWGEGYTEWTAVKKAEPLFEGHIQPVVPYEKHYYDLREKETMQWQAKLMKEYHVDGMCFYHYWFENGKRVLEKPAENLLAWKEISMPFCFAWANETWARSWSGVKNANKWSNDDSIIKPEGDGILLKQEYGNEQDWREHFDYMIPFFRDERYIRIDGKPLFLFYKPGMISCLRPMMDLWRQWAVNEGLPGLFVLGGFGSKYMGDCLDGELVWEPGASFGSVFKGMYGEGVRSVAYSSVWNEILTQKKSKNTFYGGFVGYDDTPRHSIDGIVVENASPKLFGGFLTELMAKNAANNKDITFVNAWNEWGEGMHLEPDERDKMHYLEQIQYAKENYHSHIHYYLKNEKEEENREKKFELYMNDLDLWMSLKEKKITLYEWFKVRKINKIAIYGYGIMGKHLCEELKETNLEITYVIDKQKDKIHPEYPVALPNEINEKMGTIIVASYYYYPQIIKSITAFNNVVSLADVIHELAEKYL